MENPTLLYEGGRQDEAQERSIDKTGTPPFTKSGNSGEAFSQGQAKSQWWAQVYFDIILSFIATGF
ncbi:uncharacterized protein TrAFT101_007570 [Trichoderma asperellum]|uniref:uncharacterized protein n=1 Tax=Trichoderma asperellum TaxID=101201 RepID=UPI00331CA5F9|nr:hypothetical protein TrAFT101_007570 [Trichoderma asperellum]